MKNIISKILHLSFLLLLFLTACKKDDVELNETSHQVIFTSEMDFENTIEVGGLIDFGDVSSGVESRQWTFPEGVVDILGSDNDVTSTDANVKTIFTQVGQHTVQLSQTFKEDAFVGQRQVGRNLDTSIIVTVLDSITIDLEAYYINEDGTLGNQLNLADGAKNEIPASESIRFIYTGTGEPENLNWDFERADPSFFSGSEYEIDVKYKFLGTYDLNLIAGRSRPFGRDTFIVEDLITVIPSTKPVIAEEITEIDGKIAIFFAREIEPTTLNEADFTISVENDGDVIATSFESVTIDPNEGNLIFIDLGTDRIYNDDEIKVSFNEGTLKSLDGVTATGFTDQPVVFRKTNILAQDSEFDYSFENTTAADFPYQGWGAPFDGYTLSIATDEVFEGNQSALIEMDANGGMIIGHTDTSGENVMFPVSANKTYELGVWVNVQELGDPTIGLTPDIRIYWGVETNWAVPGNPTMGIDFPTNTWVYSSLFVEFDSTGDNFLLIRGFNGSNPMPFKMYMDNLTLSEVELRP